MTNRGILYSSVSLEMHQKIGEERIVVWRLMVFSHMFDSDKQWLKFSRKKLTLVRIVLTSETRIFFNLV